MGNKISSGSLGAAGQVSPAIQMEKDFNAAIWGTFVGTAILERSFDDGVTWLPCSLNTSGDNAQYTVPASLTVYEPEGGVRYRWRCSAWTSGTINTRISQ